MLEQLRARGVAGCVYEPEGYRIRKGDRVAFLDNAFAEYCHASASHRPNILANTIALLTEPQNEADAPFGQIRDRLICVVRDRAYFSLSELDMQIHGRGTLAAPLCEPLTDWYIRTLVIDAPTQMMLVNDSMVAPWGHSTDELFAIGLENLRRASEPDFEEDARVFRGRWNDDYDASRVLAPAVFESLHLDGDPVVAIPNRRNLLVAGSNDIDALRRMLEQAEHLVRTEPRPQNPSPLLVRPDGVSDFHPDPTSPVFHEVQRAQRLSALLYYQEQAEKLGRLHASQGKSIHVSPYTLMKHDGGLYCSYAEWHKGANGLVPVADEIRFIDPSQPEGKRCVAQVPWPRVAKLVPDLLLDANLFPVLHYTCGFPSDAQLEQLARG